MTIPDRIREAIALWLGKPLPENWKAQLVQAAFGETNRGAVRNIRRWETGEDLPTPLQLGQIAGSLCDEADAMRAAGMALHEIAKGLPDRLNHSG